MPMCHADLTNLHWKSNSQFLWSLQTKRLFQLFSISNEVSPLKNLQSLSGKLILLTSSHRITPHHSPEYIFLVLGVGKSIVTTQ